MMTAMVELMAVTVAEAAATMQGRGRAEEREDRERVFGETEWQAAGRLGEGLGWVFLGQERGIGLVFESSKQILVPHFHSSMWFSFFK